ncbi:MAG: ribonuclease R [Clostridiales bacterium]|nr:ribonuclease R [Candidatus Apopatousia equi]
MKKISKKIKKEYRNVKHSQSDRKGNCVKGIISGTSKGYAFLVRENVSEDIFIPASALNGAINGDEVLVSICKDKNRKSPEGRVVEILNHNLRTLVGTIQVFQGFSFVVPDNKKISKDVFIKKEKIRNATYGDKVVVKITKYDGKNLEGEVVEVLGPNNGNSLTDVLSIIRGYELIEEFPDEVLKEAKVVSEKPICEMIKNREDFRDTLCITIDGDDSKDFDDAVSLTKDGEDFVLGVHIADVGEYVKLGSELDKEAYKRGTSAYFPNLVLPMLPKELSNGICSLNEGEDRLTLSCVMNIDKNGKVVSHKICESVIKSRNRMTYNNVTKILEGDSELNEKYKHLVPMLNDMKDLCLILEKKRIDRGSLDFEVPEPKIILDDKLEVIELGKRPRTISERLIESFMLSANETVAEHFEKLKIPFVYRIHEAPDVDKLNAFNDFIYALGLQLKDMDVSPKDLQNFLAKLEGNPLKEVINKVMLRAMQKAKYAPVCLGHFGLAATYYCHFTSPIRRYPDLTIHRIIKQYLRKQIDDKEKIKLKKFVGMASNQSSQTELSAERAERDVDDYFKARYMKNNIGKEYDGVISGITNFGVFVELDNTVEGFVPLETLQGNFTYNEKHLRLSNGNITYKMGDKVRVKVVSVSLQERKVNFIFVE